ncbi:hypothetical protein AB1Y20_019123 [Prymnesium parvum]|uniref:Polygalacturonase n=1 Tax=Prymnesium parvum TaxID=97485 RepID=A0AB34JU39_PRYPA
MRQWWLLICAPAARARWVDWQSAGAVPDDETAASANTKLLNTLLATSPARTTLFIPNRTFWLAGGVEAIGVAPSLTLQLEGTLRFVPGRKGWPVHYQCDRWHNPLQPPSGKSCVKEAFFIANTSSLTLTSNGTGTLHGGGDAWWGYIQYALHGEDRPRLLSILNVTDVLLERWNFRQSAYWTFTARDVARVEIGECTIDNRVNSADDHGLLNLAAFNTDGFDVAGRDIHIHHSTVWNQDDCFTVQPMGRLGTNARCTENILIEDVNASGLGLTVGAVRPSVDHNCIRNVTFRRVKMHHTFKGIYMKSQYNDDPKATAEITNILYDRVEMDSPTQVPIWIGPAQEADSAHACSLFWPELPFSQCPPPPSSLHWTNITLRDVNIRSPKESPGVVYGNPDQPMKNVVFENVVVSNPGERPWGSQFYKCTGVHGATKGVTSPVPPCFDATRPLDVPNSL